jgi:hypothetical protein
MKKLSKKTEVGSGRMAARIPYDAAWFTGDPVLLEPGDLGPIGATGVLGKFQSLRKHAKEHYGMGLHLDVRNSAGEPDENGDCIGLRAVALPTNE